MAYRVKQTGGDRSPTFVLESNESGRWRVLARGSRKEMGAKLEELDPPPPKVSFFGAVKRWFGVR